MTGRIARIAFVSPVAVLAVLTLMAVVAVFTGQPQQPIGPHGLVASSSMVAAAPHQVASSHALQPTQAPAATQTTSGQSQATITKPVQNTTHGTASISANCPAGTLVSTAAELKAALASATPGTVIDMASGTYVGAVSVSVSGTQAAPITLCGPADAIIEGGSKSRAFHLDGTSWWRLVGFQIQRGNKGLGLTRASHNVVTGLYIHDTEGASVHVNSFSSDNLFDGLTLRNTPKEGFYIGSTQGNWCMFSNCQPDASDRNVIQNSNVAGTGSEPINIQEGSSGGQILNNRIDGSAIVKAKEWVNVKGNGYLIDGNVGINSPRDGFDAHQTATGWGNNNVFDGNQATVNGPGYGYYIQSGTTGNVVMADNTATNAGRGFANVPPT